MLRAEKCPQIRQLFVSGMVFLAVLPHSVQASTAQTQDLKQVQQKRSCEAYKKISRSLTGFPYTSVILSEIIWATGAGITLGSWVLLKSQISDAVEQLSGTSLRSFMIQDLADSTVIRADLLKEANIDPNRTFAEHVRSELKSRPQLPTVDNHLRYSFQRLGINSEMAEELEHSIKNLSPSEIDEIVDRAFKRSGLSSGLKLVNAASGIRDGTLAKLINHDYLDSKRLTGGVMRSFAKALGDEMTRYSVDKALHTSPLFRKAMIGIITATLLEAKIRAGFANTKTIGFKKSELVSKASSTLLSKGYKLIGPAVAATGTVVFYAVPVYELLFDVDETSKSSDLGIELNYLFNGQWSEEAFCAKNSNFSPEANQRLIELSKAIEEMQAFDQFVAVSEEPRSSSNQIRSEQNPGDYRADLPVSRARALH